MPQYLAQYKVIRDQGEGTVEVQVEWEALDHTRGVGDAAAWAQHTGLPLASCQPNGQQLQYLAQYKVLRSTVV